MKNSTYLLVTAILFTGAFVHGEKTEKKAPKALLVTGGCCHDYERQQWIVTEGISARTPAEWDILMADQNKTREELSKPGWAEDYDIVVYNHCHAHETDKAFINSVVGVHTSGVPAIVLHCAMHSWHWKVPVAEGEEKEWPQLLGVTSPRHGKKARIEVTPTAPDHPVMKGFPAKWTTPQGELYHIRKVWPTATVLARGTIDGGKSGHDCVWVNEYGEGRLFGTTIGHHNETMEAKEYLDLLARGFQWALGELEE